MKKNIKITVLILTMLLFIPFLSIHAATPVRGTDVETPAEGNTFVTVRGNFSTLPKKTILDKINAIRKEACQEGIINPETGTKLTADDYKPIKWSSDLEWIAQTRAAEATVVMSHSRPNGNICFDCTHNGESTWAENIAWNFSGIMQGIDQWYSEKSDWINQDDSAVTGHYTSMINPNYEYIALGCFQLESGGYYAVSAEFSFVSGLDESQIGVSGLYDQRIEIPSDQKEAFEKWINDQKAKGDTGKKYVEQIKISGISHEIAAGRSVQLTATVLPKNASNKKVKWSSSNTKIATVTQSGKVTIKKGTGGKNVIITAKAADGSGVAKSFKIKVMKGAVKSVKIKGAKKTLKVGRQMKLKAVVTASKGKPVNKKVKWSTNNKKYATVSSKGVVKAQKGGKGRKVKITVQATDGTGKKKTVTIRIN